jgi:hypothetical protein
MAMIQGPGQFSNNQPVGNHTGIHRAQPAKAEEQNTNPQVGEDGLVLSAASPTAERSPETVTTQTGAPVAKPERETSAPVRDTRPQPQEFEGAFLVGGIGAGAMNSITSTSSTSSVSEFAFTNGLGSTKILSMSGRVLADASPFKS